MRETTVASALVAILLAVPASLADLQVVQFEDGRAMTVEQVEPAGDTTWLTLEGGGRLAVPSRRIEGLLELTPRAATTPVEQRGAADGSWRYAAGAYAELIDRVAREQGLDPVLLTAMAQVESAFDPRAVSPKGAQGLLQLMPATARRFGVRDVVDADQNVEGGARYLGWLLDRYAGRTDLALAGYNAGEGAVDRYSGVPPYRETREYVSRVLQGAAVLSGTRSTRSQP